MPPIGTQDQVSAMMCEPSSSDAKPETKQADGQILIQNAYANLLNHQNPAVGPLPSSNPLLNPSSDVTAVNNTNHTQAQYAQALQQHQHQHQHQLHLQQQQQQQQQQQAQMQLQLHMQQAAQSLQHYSNQNQNQQQQLMAQMIAATNANIQAPNQATAALQTAALLLQQQQQHQLQQLQNAAALQHMTTHNLIPKHLQASSLAASLDGTPGYQPAVILPPSSTNNGSTASSNTTATASSTSTANNNNNASNALATLNQHLVQLAATTPQIQQLQQLQQPQLSIPLTVQEDVLRNSFPPIYNGVNLQYPGLRQLHASPPVYCVDNFLTPSECQFLIQAASDVFQPAPVVGQGFGEISASRTSSTCYLARDDLPEYLRKVRLLTGKPISHCELPQVGRYFPSQRYLQHFDAFDLSDPNGRRFASNGGQRVVTVLVYLNTLTEEQGGATHFPNLNIQVQPKQGMALVFFPSTVDGLLDRQALHAALPPTGDATKYVSQVWVRQSDYKGDPSKRLNPIMGIQNYKPPSVMDVLQLKAAAGASLT